jgi:hypothetical protein
VSNCGCFDSGRLRFAADRNDFGSGAAGCGVFDAMSKLRTFESGATRDSNEGKLDYEACLSPLVLKRYAQYAKATSILPDGTIRPQDNWQRGFPLQEVMKSLWRHFIDVWTNHRGVRSELPIEEALCALIFNAQCYLHEVLKRKQ